MNTDQEKITLPEVAIKMWRERPAIRAQYNKNFIEFWDRMSQGRFDIDAEIEKINKSLRAAKEKETKAATADSKKETKAATADSKISPADYYSFEQLFIEHTARLRALQLISKCDPELVSELEEASAEISLKWTEGDLEEFMKAIEKTKRFYKKTAGIAGRSASTPTSDEDVFERLFAEHTDRMQDLRRDLQVNPSKISACFPKLAEELEKSVDEMSAAWSENNLELFKEAIERTERIYKKAAVIAEGSHPLL